MVPPSSEMDDRKPTSPVSSIPRLVQPLSVAKVKEC